MTPLGPLKNALSNRAEELCRALLPNGKKMGRYWRVGSTSGEAGTSLSVCLEGERAGFWKDFATDEGGSALDLIAACLGVDFSGAIRWAQNWIGEIPSDDQRRYSSKTKEFTPSGTPSSDSKRRREWLRITWKESTAIQKGDPVDIYLRKRGISLKTFPQVLRYHPHLAYRHDKTVISYYPALLARVDGSNGQAISILRIYLDGSGQKANVPTPKKLMPGIHEGAMKGAAIRLFEARETLAVAEGIETALAVHIATNLPVWAAVSAGGLASIVLPESVRTVFIMADLDRNGTGERSSQKLAQRLSREGREERILMPSVDHLRELAKSTGKIPKSCDWADVLVKEAT